jgi:ATPase subunit of ABC transporter with duplicated ATPase domains
VSNLLADQLATGSDVANGAGKRTLLSVLAGVLAPESARLYTRARTAFVAQDKALYKHLTPAECSRSPRG